MGDIQFLSFLKEKHLARRQGAFFSEALVFRLVAGIEPGCDPYRIFEDRLGPESLTDDDDLFTQDTLLTRIQHSIVVRRFLNLIKQACYPWITAVLIHHFCICSFAWKIDRKKSNNIR